MVKNGSNIEAWRGESFIANSFSAGGAPHGIAPRVYCAANPLRFTDPSGMITQVCDNIPQEHKTSIYATISLGKETSKGFEHLNELLESSDEVITFTTTSERETNNSTAVAWFKPFNNTIYLYCPSDGVPGWSIQTFLEEMYHAYQHLDPDPNASENNVNYEQEAKMFVAIDSGMHDLHANIGYYGTLTEDISNARLNDMSTYELINTALRNFTTKTKDFGKYYKGVVNHEVISKCVPERLTNLLRNVGYIP